MTDASSPLNSDPKVTDLDGPATDLAFDEASALPNDDTTAAGGEAGTQADRSVPDDPAGTALEGADATRSTDDDLDTFPDDPEAENPQRR
jgi:hypothetical protein